MTFAMDLDRNGRIVTLDALRGFAVMGILAMNIISYAMPEMAYITPAVYGGETGPDRITWFLSFVLIDGKMRGLFSLLFGASMMLLIERAVTKGDDPVRMHFSRMGWLAIFGLVHYFLIWFGDILFLYAVIGSLAFLFRDWEVRRLIKWALIIYAAGFVLWSAQFGGLQLLQFLAAQPDADPGLVKMANDVFSEQNFDLDTAGALAEMRGGYAGIVAGRVEEFFMPLVLVFQFGTETLPLMMIGMAMKKNGFITGEWKRDQYQRWAMIMILSGLAINAALGVWVVAVNYNMVTALAALMAWGLIPRIMLTIGYAALLILLIKRLEGSAFVERVAAAGQAAFTNYLGTSILMTTIFYGYGLGLYGSVGRAPLMVFVLSAWIIMLLWSKPWLHHFRYGPLEWLWRSLAKWQIQPMRKLG